MISETRAQELRRFVSSQMLPDEYMGDRAEGYRVNSLYLDTFDARLYRESLDGIKNRHKLRIRFYDDRPESPAFLEIKKRTTDTIHKLRATVSKQAAERLLAGERLEPTDLLNPSEASLRALTAFCDRVDRMHLVGAAFVSYRREAYVSYGIDGERVTFDRHVVGGDYRPGDRLGLPDDCAPVTADGVVLELKYLRQLPVWMHELITTFQLQRVSYPKYVHGVDALRGSRELTASYLRSRLW